jgi:uncharacterized membrane protein
MIQDQPTSSFGLSPNVAAGIAALFGWLGGLIILLGKPPQQWVRFVAVQSIVLSVAYFAVIVALNILGVMLSMVHLGIVALLLFPIEMLVFLVFIVALIMTTIKGFQGQAMRLPLIAEWADRFVPASTSL